MGGQNAKISSGAPICAVQVKVFLSDLFKLIKGAFHSTGLVLFDLKGGCGSTFCVVDFALFTAFLSVDSPQLQGPKFDQTTAAALMARLMRLYKTCFLGALLPEGLKVANY